MSKFIIATNNNNNNPFFKVMDGQVSTEKGHLAVSSGKGGGVRMIQILKGEEFEATLTDLFSQCVRDKNHMEFKKEVKELFDIIDKNNNDNEKKINYIKLFCKFMMNLRDPREGKGERDLFHIMFIELFQHQPEIASKLILKLGSKYGSYLDLPGLWVRIEKVDVPVLSEKFCKKIMNTSDVKFSPEYILKQLKLQIRELISRTILDQILVDLALKEQSKPYSLCSKFVPREGGKTKEKKTIDCISKGKLYRKLANMWYLELPTVKENLSNVLNDENELKSNAKIYARTAFRKIIVSLRKDLIVERKMSKNNWDTIDFSKVPAGANKKYGKLAFQNLNKDMTKRSTDEKRIKCAENYSIACQNAIDGKTGGIKGKASGPVDPVAHYMRGGEYDISKEGMFADLIRITKEKMQDGGGLPSNVCISDVSGSMKGKPMEVCIALSLVLQEVTPKPWNGRVLTFSSTPKWHIIKGNSLKEKVECLKNAEWGGSTNFEESMNLILEMAKENNLSQNDMPKMLFCFSDMQFDQAQGHGYYHNVKSNTGYVHAFSSLKESFANAGYNIPHIVFWNLRASKAQPCETISEGVSTMSGYSENMFKAFLEGDVSDLAIETPWDRLKKVLDDEHYDDIDEIVIKYVI